MSTLKQIKGFSIQTLTSDPKNLEEGQIYYNSSDKNIKKIVYEANIGPGVWTSGGNMATTRTESSGAGYGYAGNAVAVGGFSSGTQSAAHEYYGGTSWTNRTSMSSARATLAGAAAGNVNYFMVFGGRISSPSYLARATTEEYSTTWTSGGNLTGYSGNGVYGMSGAGSQNAGLGMGGYDTQVRNYTMEYDGTSWTNVTGFGNFRYNSVGAGTQNSGLLAGGRQTFTTGTSMTEEYNGTSWTAGGNLVTQFYSGAGGGTQNQAVVFGGKTTSSNPVVSTTQSYDGSVWSTNSPLSTARWSLSGNAVSGKAIESDYAIAVAFGGNTGSADTNATEEFNTSTGVGIKVATLS